MRIHDVTNDSIIHRRRRETLISQMQSIFYPEYTDIICGLHFLHFSFCTFLSVVGHSGNYIKE